MNALALFDWTAVVLIAWIVFVAVRYIRDGVRSWRTKRAAWRDGGATVHGLEYFNRIEPPARNQPKSIAALPVRGRLTYLQLLEIENCARSAKNLFSGPGPMHPAMIADLTDIHRLALVDVPRLLAHIRMLEEERSGGSEITKFPPCAAIPLRKGAHS